MAVERRVENRTSLDFTVTVPYFARSTSIEPADPLDDLDLPRRTIDPLSVLAWLSLASFLAPLCLLVRAMWIVWR